MGARVTGLRTGATYRFTVAARNTVGLGPAVSLADVRLPDVPQAPVSLAVERGDGRVRVTWERPPSDGGLGILGYVVTAHPRGVSVETSGPELTAVVEGLTNGEATTVSVRAVNEAGPGPESAPSASVVPARAPAAPASVSPMPGVRKVSVSWQAPADTGGLPVSGYVVTAMPGGASQQVDGATTSAVFTGLENDTAYSFTVAARNEVGPGQALGSEPVLTPALPGAPSLVEVTPGVRSLAVAWTPPASDGREPLSGFTVTASPSGASVEVGAGVREAVLEDVPSTKEQTVTITARNAVGVGPGSTASRLRTRPAPVELTGLEVPSEQGGCRSVNYELRQVDGERADVLVEVDADGDGTFTRATQAGSETASGLVALEATRTGWAHAFRWNRSRDIPGAAASARVRVTATVPGSPPVTQTLPVTLAASSRRCELDLDSSPVKQVPVSPAYNAKDLALGDFDRDGKLDLVVIHDGGTGISFLPGLGNGRFGRPIPNPHSLIGDTLTAADLNGDGRLDLISVNFDASIVTTVRVALAMDGSGLFEAPVSTVLASSNESLRATPAVVKDLDGDGTPEVVVSDTHNLYVLRHTGGGKLSVAFTAPAIPRGVVVAGDFDENGIQDLMVVGDTFHAFLGRGLLAFTPEHLGTLGGPVPSAVSGDFNGDGHLDIVALVLGSNPKEPVIQLLPGDGGGRFLAPVRLHAHTNWTGFGNRAWLATADLDADGRLDLAYVDGESETVTLLRGKGDGTFETRKLTAGRYATRLAVGDFDASGRPDLAVLSWWDDVRVLRDLEVPEPSVIGTNAVTADFDGDGWNDVASLVGDALQVHLTRPEGGLVPRGPSSVPPGTVRLVPGRFDADATVDVVALSFDWRPDGTTTGSLGLLRGTGAGTFASAEVLPTGGSTEDLAAGDVDGDGDLDVVHLNVHRHGADQTSEVRLLRGLGDGSFAPGAVIATHTVVLGLALEDLNKDGRADLLVLRSVYPNFELTFFEGRADGTLAKVLDYVPSVPNATCSPSSQILIDDLDRDGDRDIIVGCEGWAGGVFPLWSQGGFRFFEMFYHSLHDPVQGLAVGDLDGDGAREVIAATPNSKALCVLTIEGAGSNNPPACFGTVYSRNPTHQVALLDVEHDGVLEVLGSGPDTGTTLLRLK